MMVPRSLAPPGSSHHGPRAGRVMLNEQQKHRFVRDGFLHVPAVVPRALLARARRAINQSIGSGFQRDELTRLNAQSFCTELCNDARLLRLATTPAVWSHVQALLGNGRSAKPQECQIALRFPLPEGTWRRLPAGRRGRRGPVGPAETYGHLRKRRRHRSGALPGRSHRVAEPVWRYSIHVFLPIGGA